MDIKTILIIIISILGILIQTLFIYIESLKKYIPAVILKGSASLCFLTVGIIAFTVSKNKDFSILILIGLILGVIGDILLNLRFVVKKEKSNLVFLIGTASFLSGHILYIVSLFKLANIVFIYVPILSAIVITTIVALLIFKILTVKNSMKIFGVVYILIVSLFTCVANYNLAFSVNNLTLLTGIGSLLFFLSDVILIFNSFGKNPKLYFRATNLILYFVGQILIASALLFI